MTLTDFLKSKAVSAATQLARRVASNLTRGEGVNLPLLVAMLNALRALDLKEEMRFFGIILTCHYGGKGEVVPASVAAFFPSTATLQEPVAKPALVSQSEQPASKPTAPPATAPARTMTPEEGEQKPFNPENGHFTWKGFLKGILNGNQIPWSGLQNLTSRLVDVGYNFSLEDYKLLFNAMKVAGEHGKYIVDSNAAPKFFTAAPAGMTEEYVFGQDGALSLILGDFDSIEAGKGMPKWLVAKTFILAYAVQALDSKIEGGLGPQEVACVRKVLNMVNRSNGPDNLAEVLMGIVGGKQSARRAEEATPEEISAYKLRAAAEDNCRNDGMAVAMQKAMGFQAVKNGSSETATNTAPAA